MADERSSRKILDNLLRLPGNDSCADCGAPGPKWASASLGIFICIDCAGIHRLIGTHISRIKSVKLDHWTDEAVKVMQEKGNTRVKSDFERPSLMLSLFPRPNATTPSYYLEGFIRAKYEQRLFHESALEDNCEIFSKYPQRSGTISVMDGLRWTQATNVTLKSNILSIQQDPKSEKPEIKIPLSDCIVFNADQITGRQYSLGIQTCKKRYFISFKNTREFFAWYLDIRISRAIQLSLGPNMIEDDLEWNDAVSSFADIDALELEVICLRENVDKIFSTRTPKRRFITVQDNILSVYSSELDEDAIISYNLPSEKSTMDLPKSCSQLFKSEMQVERNPGMLNVTWIFSNTDRSILNSVTKSGSSVSCYYTPRESPCSPMKVGVSRTPSYHRLLSHIMPKNKPGSSETSPSCIAVENNSIFNHNNSGSIFFLSVIKLQITSNLEKWERILLRK